MQIKLEKFLALTALLASAPLAGACTPDEAGQVNADKADASPSNHATSSHVDAGHKPPAVEDAGGGSATIDTGVDAGSTPTDAGSQSGEQMEAAAHPVEAAAHPVEAAVSPVEAGPTPVDGDAAMVPDSGMSDGGPSAEGSLDAGGQCGPALAAESFDENCLLFDSCYEQADPPGGLIASDTCYGFAYTYRAGVSSAFWDCYTAAAVEDPCSEAADVVAQECASASIENACVAPDDQCGLIATESCAEVDQDECAAAVAPYSSNYLDSVGYCFSLALDTYGPDFEGCADAFYGCVASPSVE